MISQGEKAGKNANAGIAVISNLTATLHDLSYARGRMSGVIGGSYYSFLATHSAQ